MSIETPNVIHAMAEYDGTGIGVFLSNSGFASAVRNNVGNYSLTLEQAVRAILSVTVTQLGNDALVSANLSTSTGVMEVQAFDNAGAPRDIIFDVIVFAMPQQNAGF